MAADVSPTSDVPPRNPTRHSSTAGHISAVLILVALLAFIGERGRALWTEWDLLRREKARIRETAVVGYYDICANPSYAQKPRDWYHDDGGQTLIWAGWKHGRGHCWFRVGRGEIERSRISPPMGRDVVRAIDHPIIEVGGGRIWDRIPDGAPAGSSPGSGSSTPSASSTRSRSSTTRSAAASSSSPSTRWRAPRTQCGSTTRCSTAAASRWA